MTPRATTTASAKKMVGVIGGASVLVITDPRIKMISLRAYALIREASTVGV